MKKILTIASAGLILLATSCNSPGGGNSGNAQADKNIAATPKDNRK